MRDFFNEAEMSEFEQNADASVQKLTSAVRHLSQQLLLTRMKDLGQKYLGDSNAPGLDLALWKTVIEVPVRLSDEEVTELEGLSAQAGGWWKLGAAPDFLDIEAWTAEYRAAINPGM
jgi:hypothetical protein